MNAPCSEKSEEGIVYELFAIVGLEGANNKLELCLHKVAEGSNMSSNLRFVDKGGKSSKNEYSHLGEQGSTAHQKY